MLSATTHKTEWLDHTLPSGNQQLSFTGKFLSHTENYWLNLNFVSSGFVHTSFRLYWCYSLQGKRHHLFLYAKCLPISSTCEFRFRVLLEIVSDLLGTAKFKATLMQLKTLRYFTLVPGNWYGYNKHLMSQMLNHQAFQLTQKNLHSLHSLLPEIFCWHFTLTKRGCRQYSNLHTPQTNKPCDNLTHILLSSESWFLSMVPPCGVMAA